MPNFRVKSVKIYTGQKKIYTGAARGARDKYEVWESLEYFWSQVAAEVGAPLAQAEKVRILNH